MLPIGTIIRFYLEAVSSLSQVSVAYNFESSAYNLGVAVELKNLAQIVYINQEEKWAKTTPLYHATG